MKSRVNLATKPMAIHRRFYAATALAGVITTVLFFVLAWHVYAARKADAAFRAQKNSSLMEIQKLLEERQELDRYFSQPENARLHERADSINSILDARSFNWTRMFMDLERVLPSGVRIMTIEPKQVNGLAAVTLTVGATSEEAQQKFLSALGHSDAFSQLQLVNVRPAGPESATELVILELTLVYSRA